jgi:hypothetical protein
MATATDLLRIERAWLELAMDAAIVKAFYGFAETPPMARTPKAATASKTTAIGTDNFKQLRELIDRRRELDEEIETSKAARDLVDQQITAIATSTGQVFDRLNPDEALAGEQTVEFQPHEGGAGIRLKGEVKKTVKWSTDALLGVASAMPWDTVREIFKVEFSVPEATWKAISEGAYVAEDTRRAIAAARTVKYAPLAVRPA